MSDSANPEDEIPGNLNSVDASAPLEKVVSGAATTSKSSAAVGGSNPTKIESVTTSESLKTSPKTYIKASGISEVNDCDPGCENRHEIDITLIPIKKYPKNCQETEKTCLRLRNLSES
ncbi:uncharacterized protein LOC107273996 [Cephus cinctus]|uniref:Uncharacterized protein LOC107273996 n=1 Tax=Cephus cinctus TaxID=211228 RepID=A0AAJ7RUY4_CEPCN|nr:uncharacterized protein LOC107273996 [Cephus cinctus]